MSKFVVRPSAHLIGVNTCMNVLCTRNAGNRDDVGRAAAIVLACQYSRGKRRQTFCAMRTVERGLENAGGTLSHARKQRDLRVLPDERGGVELKQENLKR